MIKRVLFLFVLVVSFALVSSASVCPTNYGDLDIIYKASDVRNAHTALWNEGPYNIAMCYSWLWNPVSNPQIPGNIHDCSGKTPLFYLSGKTNAHVSISGGNGYSEPLCYGDFSCNFEQTEGDPNCVDPQAKVIARFSNSTNAHLSNPSDTNFPIKVCCRPKSSTQPMLFWKNGDKLIINKIYLDKTLGNLAVATITNYNPSSSPGMDDTFDIYEASSKKYLEQSSRGVQDGNDFVFIKRLDVAELEKLKITRFDDFRFDIDGKTSPDLKIMFCGDNEKNGNEECDFGSSNDQKCTASGYGKTCSWCDSSCKSHSVGEFCGDGILQSPPEQCEPGKGLPLCTGTNTPCCTAQCAINGNGAEPYWSNLLGYPIKEATEGDTVGMILLGGAGQTDPIFDIFEDDGLGNVDPIVKITGQNVFNDALGSWKIPSISELKKLTEDLDDFKFDVRGKITPNKLKIVPGNSKNPININLVEPLCGKDVKVGDSVTIKFEIFDLNDLISWNLTIDGVVKDKYNFKNVPGGSYSVQHTFNNKGTSKIRIYAENQIGERASIVSNIIVIDPDSAGKYSAACIRSPKNFEFIDGDYADFDASNSRGIDYDPVNGKSELSLKDLNFYWDFSDGRTNPNSDGGQPISYNFYKFFQNYGDNWADLKVGIK